MDKIENLFEKRLLKKIPMDFEKVKSSLKISKSKPENAKRLFESGFYGDSLLSAYTSMFHSARALLYYEGIQEKSHYGVYVYLRERFSHKIPLELLNSLNFLREERHKILYGFEEDISKEQVENSILNCEEFLEVIGEILK